MENNIGIYLYTNVHTCKVYVGQSKNLHRRHNNFLNFNGSYGGRKIDCIRKKYNHPEDWDYKILVYCSEEELDFYESYYIGVYDSVRSGYNCESGGNKNKQPDEQVRKTISEKMKSYFAVNENREKQRVRQKRIYNNNNEIRKKISKKSKAYYANPENRKSHSEKCKTKKVVLQYDLEGNFINEYPSRHEAARQTGISPSGILFVCQGKSKYMKGYVFKYKKDE